MVYRDFRSYQGIRHFSKRVFHAIISITSDLTFDFQLIAGREGIETTMKKQAKETFARGILLENEAQFEKAKAIYEDFFHHVTDETFLRKVCSRPEDIDDLIAEKAVCRRIDENAKRVLTEISINISEN